MGVPGPECDGAAGARLRVDLKRRHLGQFQAPVATILNRCNGGIVALTNATAHRMGLNAQCNQEVIVIEQLRDKSVHAVVDRTFEVNKLSSNTAQDCTLPSVTAT